MPTWKQINENGGTYVLRFVCGLIAIGILVALTSVTADAIHAGISAKTARGVGACVAALMLFGGYALYGNRLKASSDGFGTTLRVEPRRSDDDA